MRFPAVASALLVLAILVPAPAPAAGPLEGPIIPPGLVVSDYTVKAGDTCRGIARRHWPGWKKPIARFHSINRLGPPPHTLKPGWVVKVVTAPPPPPPPAVKKDATADELAAAKAAQVAYEAAVADVVDPEDTEDAEPEPAPAPPPPPVKRPDARPGDAKLTFVRPMVEVRPKDARDWNEAKPGRDLFRLDSVSTKATAGAELRFRDDSYLRMHENALIVVYGPGGEPPPAPGAPKSGAVQLVQGDLRLGLARLRGDRMNVLTENATVSAASRDFTVGIDEKKAARVAVHDGEAKVEAAGKIVSVAAGFGTKVEPGKPPDAPAALPGAPQWTRKDELFMVVDPGAGAPLELSWEKQKEATAWRVELARDPGFFGRVAAELRVTEPRLAAAVPNLGRGRLFVRVLPLSPSGFWGAASSLVRLEVVGLSAPNGKWDADKRVLRAKGGTRVTLTPAQPVVVTLDGKPAGRELDVRTPGLHELKIVADGAESVPALVRIEIEP